MRTFRPLSRMLRSAFALQSSVLNVALSNRMERPNQDALSEDNTHMQYNRRRRESRHVNSKMKPQSFEKLESI